MCNFYLKWQVDPSKIPDDPEKRVKAWLMLLEMVRADMQAGLFKDWGMAAGGNRGYGIIEETSEAELFARLLKWMPYIKFEVEPIITVDQAIASVKKAVAEQAR